MLCIFSVGIAAIVPYLDVLISLVGAFASSALALMFPPLIEFLTLYREKGVIVKLTLVKDVLIFIFGIVGFITGTYASLVQLVEEVKNDL